MLRFIAVFIVTVVNTIVAVSTSVQLSKEKVRVGHATDIWIFSAFVYVLTIIYLLLHQG